MDLGVIEFCLINLFLQFDSFLSDFGLKLWDAKVMFFCIFI